MSVTTPFEFSRQTSRATAPLARNSEGRIPSEPEHPVRVLHICESFNPGGVVWWLADIVRHIPQEEFLFDFHCCGTEHGMRAREVLRLGSRITLFQPSVAEVLWGARLRNVLRQRRYSIVHAHLFHLSGWLLRHAYRLRIPVRIAHFHCVSDGRAETPINRMRRRIGRFLVSRYANGLLACSEAALQAAPNLKTPLLRSIQRYGIETNRPVQARFRREQRARLGIAETTPVVGHVGRLVPEKNHQALLEIFRCVLRKLPEACLILVGDGPLRERIHRQAVSLGIEHRVRFLGARDDVAEILPVIDVFCFPSTSEGLGIAVLEARAAGIPVVASDLLGIAQALEGSGEYTLVRPESPERFASATIRYLNERAVSRPPGQWSEMWSTRSSAAKLLACYRELLGAAAGAPGRGCDAKAASCKVR